jgi:hypothetical protein
MSQPDYADAATYNPDTVTRSLECEITDAEALERAADIGDLSHEIKSLKSERRALNARLRECTERVADLGDAIESRKEQRDVPCEWRPDYAAKTWELFRLDTHAPLGEARPMTSADLQQRLQAVDDTAADPDGLVKLPKRKRAPKKTASR